MSVSGKQCEMLKIAGVHAVTSGKIQELSRHGDRDASPGMYSSSGLLGFHFNYDKMSAKHAEIHPETRGSE